MKFSLIKTVLFSLIFFGFVFNFFAQEKDMEYPKPVGGIMAIAQNVIYPEEAHKNNVEGKVIIEVVIDQDGSILETKVLKGIGSGCDEAAVAAIEKTKFLPAEQDGKNVKSKVVIPVSFKLKNKKS